MDVVVTTGAIRLQSSSQIVPTNSQYFLQAVALPVAQPTVLEHLRKIFLSSTVITKFQQESLSGHYVCTRRWQSVQFSTEIAVYLGNGMSGNRGSLIA